MSRLTNVALILALCLPAAAHAAPADLPVVAPVMSCADLAQTDLTGIGGAGSSVTAAETGTSAGHEVCTVTGTLAPEIGFQMVLPTQGWTQRYLQIGCGGLCGNIMMDSGASAGCAVLDAGGFVMAATDMGHSSRTPAGQSGAWGLNDRQRTDFAYRAQHLTAETAKALIAAFYGQPQKYSYFNGCSDGGREAVMEAMRYPEDFDGIVAGAPAMLFQVQNTLFHGWQARANTDADGNTILISAKLPALHQAVLAACDADDGVTDELISRPDLCRFDPAVLACAGDETDQCLTPAQLRVVRDFYAGPRDPSGAFLTPGQPQYGSELNWQGVYVSDAADQPVFSTQIALPVLRYLAFQPARPEMSLADLQFTLQTLDDLRPRHPLFDATSPDLSAFRDAGGKLILWHGLADPHISPANTVAFREALETTMGHDAVAGFNRLYLLPGVSHCGGGQGPSQLDLLTPMMAWVETDTAPDAVLTRSTAKTSSFGQPDGSVSHGGMPTMQKLDVAPLPDMTRPVWPWPATAALTAGADPVVAESWTRGPDAQVVLTRDWPGADLFAPYQPAE